MKRHLCLVILLLTMVSRSVLAHEGHWDGMGLDEVIAEGVLELKQLVDQKELPELWRPPVQFNYDQTDGLIKINGKERWVLAYTNPREKDITKQTIRMVFTPKGKFIGYEFIETKRGANLMDYEGLQPSPQPQNQE